ncbi:TPA: flagellar motor switch protein FliN [Candidatus Sumerlaeota bacterium]|jgi:flagellar motor switch protein FliN|nr:flagellar motor switch protein FliN [Candidatus Sumerlaeota bacterium]
MADPTDPKTGSEDEEISWEDAFREMAEASQGGAAAAPPPTPEPTHEPAPQPAAAPRGGPTASATAPYFGASQQPHEQGSVDIDFLLDLPLDVTVEVGRCKMLINELLQLQQGSVIQLEKMVGEPFEVYVNRKLMAFGEVVVVNEKFGIRLTDVIDPKERIQQLG